MLEGFRFLAVDDDEMSLEMLSSILIGQGSHCTKAVNGKDALDILEAHPDFDIILLDLQMPVMDGFELISQCKGNPYLSHIPIIVLASDRNEKLRSLKLGADDFMGKPYDLEELELRAAKLVHSLRLAQSARKAKSDLISIATHELRTPMYHITGLAELLDVNRAAVDQLEIVAMLKESVNNLVGTVRDIMNYVQLDHGAEGSLIEPFSLRDTLRKIVAAHQPAAAEKGIRLECTVAEDVSDTLHGFSYFMQTIFNCLINNAIKFSSGGTVHITIREESLGYSHSRFHCSVSDQGIGIPDDLQERIFEPFIQADSSLTRKYSGLGLGLSIAKRMVELMGGVLRITSSSPAGSTFEFSFHCDLESGSSNQGQGSSENLTP